MASISWNAYGGGAAPRYGTFVPPSRWLWPAEYRSLWELGLSLVSTPALLSAPPGDGHPVLVLPGFLASDLSTNVMRAYLRRLGYAPHAWNLGRNWGGVYRMRESVRARLAAICAQAGRPVSVVGWSLGGIYARDVALALPECVRYVITLGSPFSRDPGASNVSDIYERISGEGPTYEERAAGALFPHEFDRLADPLPMPSTSIYSKTDGIVNWRSSRLRPDARSENVEVIGASHIGLGVNPAVLWAIADRLAQPHGRFTAFARSGPFGFAYGRPERDPFASDAQTKSA